jgi:hypothetical protein
VRLSWESSRSIHLFFDQCSTGVSGPGIATAVRALRRRLRAGRATIAELGISARSGKAAEVDIASNGSQEDIIRKSFDEMPYAGGDVMVHTTYHVQSSNRDEESSTVGTLRKDGHQSDVVALNRAV